MKNKAKVKIGMWPLIIIFISLLNLKFNFISIPNSENMADRQIAFTTISTVFAGFSFTALGLLLGLSSEKLIERIKNTTIVMDKVKRILTSIVYFIVSVVFSLFFILGLNEVFFPAGEIYDNATSILYVLSVGTMIVGMGYFVCCVCELYDLVKRIYDFNKDGNEQMERAMKEVDKAKEKLRQVDLYSEE